MSESLLSPLHISKLGHSIEEIRVRALSSVISKYNLQLVDETNLENTKQLLKKLLDWFMFDTHPQEEKVLKLIVKILQYKNADLIFKEIGVIEFKKKLQIIEKKIDSKFLQLIENIKDRISRIEEDPNGVLGFDKGCDDSIQILNIINFQDTTDTDILNTVSTGDSKKNDSLTKETLNKPLFKLEYFNWQSLVASDRHVLSSIYDGLRYIDNKNSILQSCQFFMDVVSKDFPTEIFLQRPLIIQTFFALLECNQDEIRLPVLNCLIETVHNLKYRFKFSLDVSVASFKQEFLANATYPSLSRDSEDIQSDKSGLPEQFHLNLGLSDDEGLINQDDDEDNSFLRKHQSSLPNFCFVVLLQAIPHLSKDKNMEEYNLYLKLIVETLTFLEENLNDLIWKHECDAKEKIYQIFGLFQTCLKYQKNKNKVMHTIVLTIVTKFLSFLKPPTGAEVGEILPRGIQTEIASCIMDFVLIMLYPEMHSEIVQYVRQLLGMQEREIMQCYEDTIRVCKSMKSAVKILKFPNQFKKKLDKLSCANEALLCLDFHKNFNFIKEFVKNCLVRWSRRSLKDEESKLRDAIFIKLLSHSDDQVKLFTYKEIHAVVIKLLGVEGAANPKFEYPGDKTEFLFNSEILTEIICHGLSSQIAEVRKHSNEIMIHLLKAKFLMSEPFWLKFMKNLEPCLPLLQCHAEKSTALGRCIVKMLDPDMADTISLSLTDVMKGNLRLLFSKDNLTRDEAITRLFWLLTKEEGSQEKLPRMSILQGMNLSGVCSSVEPREFTRAKQSFYSSANLCDVIEMLNARNVEPSVRRSGLSQISVMLDDRDLHSIFLEQNGLEMVLDILNNCLIEKEFHNYPDSVLPIFNILKQLVLHNTPIRQELSMKINVYYCVLRGMFLFSGDERLRRNASELLFLLLYSEHIITVPPDRSGKCWISLPQLVTSKMCMPFLTHIHWKTSAHSEPSIRETIMVKDNCARLIRMYWIVEWFESLSDVLTLDYSDLEGDIFSAGLPKDMKLTDNDLTNLKNGALSFAVKQRLYDVQNATSHESALESIHKLQNYLILHHLTESEESTSSAFLIDLPWKSTLERFLKLMPSGQQDESLLYHIIGLIRDLLKILKCDRFNNWILKLFHDGSQSLPKLLKTIGNEDFGMKGREVRRAVVLLAQDVAAGNPETEWSLYLHLIADNLKLDNKQEYYNVAYIDWFLGLLVDMTGSCNHEAGIELYEELIVRVMEIIVSFHCSKDSSRSFMGMNIVKNSILILNNILSDTMNYKGWEQLWFHALSKVSGHTDLVNYSWLLSLWFIRDASIRAGAFQLLAGFATTERGCQLLMEDLRIEFEHVWNFGFQILLDEDECSWVRDKCATLLSNLTCQGSSVTSGVFLQHLININYYREMVNIISKLQFATTLDQRTEDDAKSSHVITTPAFLSSASSLLFNIICLNPEAVISQIIETGLFENLLRVLQDVCDIYVNCSGVLPTEVISMCCNVCSVISQCTSVNTEAYSYLSRSYQTTTSLFGLANYNLYCLKTESVLELRNRLWGEILNIFSIILTADSKTNGLVMFNQTLNENGVDHFNSMLYLCLTTSEGQLREQTLNFLINLFGCEIRNQDRFSVSDIFDRNISTEVVKLAINYGWKGYVISEEMTNNFGIRLCDALLQIYMITQANKKHLCKDKAADALGGLLAVCKNAQDFGIDHGLGESIVLTLKQAYVKLNLETVESLKRLSDKKRIEPWLLELETTFRLLCNLMVGNGKVKTSISFCGLADIIHKLWSWCNAKGSLLNMALKMLCTYTHDSDLACKSFVLTSSVTGVGLRKSPGSITLIHAITNQITREMDSTGKANDSQTLSLSLQLLSNCCQVTECRAVMAKSPFLQSFVKLHSNFGIKKRKQNDECIDIWLDFFVVFTSHQEGQLALTKNEELFDLLVSIPKILKSSTRLKALTILRNVCFHQLNRIRMLSSCTFLSLMLDILSSKETEEINLAAVMVWSLSYNSQKAKLVFRNGNFEGKLLEAKRNCNLANDSKTSAVIDTVLAVLKNK